MIVKKPKSGQPEYASASAASSHTRNQQQRTPASSRTTVDDYHSQYAIYEGRRERPRRKQAQASRAEEEENDEENIVIDMADEDDDESQAGPEATHSLGDEVIMQKAANQAALMATNFKEPVEPAISVQDDEPNNNSQPTPAQFEPGDLIWFDPNQLGYSIPGKVLDFYQELSVLTVEGCGQPLALEDPQLEEQLRNRLLLKADEQLQVYELSDPQLFKSIRVRRPISSEFGISDLVELDELSHESLIWNLKLRFKQDLIYTKCGHKILFALNPFKQLSNLYSLDQVQQYDALDAHKLASLSAPSANSSELIRWLLLNERQQTAKSSQRAREAHQTSLAPHIFGLANEALKQLLTNCQDQCFVLLGDSGAGKTETAKLLVQYYATVNKSPTNLITEQILESIQVLESFGNAKTVANNNSSRFGKLLELRFKLANGFIHDAKTIDLNLLDRARIVCQNERERNYNVFYELLAGLSQLEKEKYGLQSAEKYFYLNQGHCVELQSKDDSEDFRSLLSSMQVLGFNYEEQDTIFRILATILHLGNIYFHRKLLAVRIGTKFDNSEQQQRQQANGGIEGVEIGSDTEARWVSHLLQVQFELVLRCLTVRTIETGATVQPGPEQASGKQHTADCIVSPLNIDQALDTRDAIARALYTCLFKWLVQRINVMISNKSSEMDDEQQVQSDQKEESTSEPIYLCRTSESLCEFQPDKLVSASQRQVQRHKDKLKKRDHKQQLHASQQLATLSILDAFGFENLAENNFEQLCVNYAAELLHYHTSRYLVRLEQAEYVRERIRWQPIDSLAGHPLSTSGSAEVNTLNSNASLNQQYGSFDSFGRSNSLASSQQRQAAGIVNLISKKPLGILALLDDECNFPKATDQSFAEKCHHNHALNENYQCARLAANSQEFGIRHYRRTTRMVWYQVEGFIEKNRDSLRADVMELLLGSKMNVVADMLRKLHKPYSSPGQSGGAEGGSLSKGGAKTISRTYDGRYVSMKPRAATVAAKFQDTLQNNRVLEALNQVSSLSQVCAHSSTSNGHYAATLELSSASASSRGCLAQTYASIGAKTVALSAGQQANPWFIVCLKPNRSKAARIFDVAYVQEQVHAMNLLALTQMRRIGYPVRLRYPEFLRRYKCLVTRKFLADRQLSTLEAGSRKQTEQQMASIRDICTSLIELKLGRDAAQSSRNSNSLGALFQCGLTKVFLNERLFHKLESWRLAEYQKSILAMQKTWKMWLERREFLDKRRASIVIQANWRGQLARRLFMQQYMLIVLLQRRWRGQLEMRRRKELEARRRAIKQRQRAQLDELKAQQNKLANQLRFRVQPKSPAMSSSSNQDKSHYYTSSNSTSSSSTNTSRTPTNLLNIPEDLAQLYRLQRDWLPQHDLSHLSRVDLAELAEKELARRAEFGSHSSSVPFVVLESERAHAIGPNGHHLASGNPLEQAAGLIGRLDLDERFSLKQFVSKYFHPDVPQFGYSRLPITRPFSWRQMLRCKQRAIRRTRSLDCDLQHRGAFDGRFIALEQKAVAIYKLLLRYIDSDHTNQRESSRLQGRANQQEPLLDEHQRDQEAVQLQQLLKFKLISDYINYLCLTEPLLRDELFLQLASLAWQNPKARSLENVWKLLLNCLACFEPLDCNLIKHLLKYVADHCQSSKYKQLLCSQLFLALERAKANYKLIAGSKHRRTKSKLQPQVSALSEQRRFPTTIMEYWANQSAQTRLAIAASCYMDDHSLSATDLEQLARSERSISKPDFELRQIINYSAKTLVQVDSHSRAERVANDILRSRGVGEPNLVGWSLEIQHEGALSEFSSRLRGDDHLMDHFARLELLPELVQLIDDDLEALDCEQLDELGVAVNLDDASEQIQPGETTEEALASCYRSSDLSRPLNDHQELRREAAGRLQGKRSRLGSEMSNRSWDLESTQLHVSRPHSGQYLRRHSAALSELDLLPSRRSSGQFHYKYAQHPQQVSAVRDCARDERQPFEPNGLYRASRAELRQTNHRRSMSMQELQLAASSALNERYFMQQTRLPSSRLAGESREFPCCRAPSSLASGNSRTRRQSGSLRHLDQASNQPLMMPPQRQFAGGCRRSATPNSLLSSGYYAHRKQPFSASSSIYGYACSTRDDNRAHLAGLRDSHGYADFGPQQERYAGSHKLRGPALDAVQQARPRRAGSTSSRPPGDFAVPPTSDYASTHSDYEQIAVGRANRRLHSKVASPQQQHRVTMLEQSLGEPSGREHDNSAPHYAASSAMSDTSEAPSLASHVKNVKVPLPNGDLDRYLDDLFNPLLDGADLDELSDARSMATSIRGLGAGLSSLFDAEQLSKTIRGTGNKLDKELAQSSNTSEQRETQSLSPTFESLLRSLKTQASGLADGHDQPLSTTAQLVRKSTNLHELNLSQLKELNRKLEDEIQAAQRARQSLSMTDSPGSPTVPLGAPLPPPLPNFSRSRQAADATNPDRASSSPMSQATLDDIYSRAKTIRIGKWRWPPPAEDSSAQDIKLAENDDDDEQLFAEQLAALSLDRKRSSILSAGSGGSENDEAVRGVAESEEKHLDVSNSQASCATVGRLKISSEMKAKLESLTNSSSGRVSESASSSGAHQAPSGGARNESGDAGAQPKRLNEQRKLLLANKLMGAAKNSDTPDALEQQRPTSAGSKVLAVKQQLAAAAGVALSALDSHSAGSSQASSRRQSSQLVAPVAPDADQQRRLVLENDELGPQSRAAINQRQAFYLDADQITSSKPSRAQQEGFIAEPPVSFHARSQSQPQQRGQASGGGENAAIAKSKLPVNLYGIDREKLRVEGSSASASDQWTWSPSGSRNATVARSWQAKAGSNKRQESVREPLREAAKKESSSGQSVECLTYANVNWQVRIRKELFTPSESYDDQLVVQLIFAQLVADVFNPRHWTRLNHKERAAIKAMMKDNSIGYSPSLPQIGQLQEVKRKLVRMARSFGLYFTRSYQALNFACLTENHPLLRRPSGGSSAGNSSCESPSGDETSETSSLCAHVDENVEYLGPKEAIRLAQQLRAKASLGADWIDMVAVHHSGLRLVALVCDQRPKSPSSASQRQSVTSDRLSIRNSKQFIANQIGAGPGGESSELPPTPPIGYKVLETLKFRDMADVRQLNERLLLLSMAPDARTSSAANKCWLISSSQGFHLDYNTNVRHSATNSRPTTEASNIDHQRQHQPTRNRKPASSSEFDPQAKLERQRNRQDFDDENDDQSSQATSGRHEAPSERDSQQAAQNRRTEPPDSSKYSTLTGSNRLSSGGSGDAQTLRSSGTAVSSVKDDGKYSMLQFALYNFREAIEKYSLESRASLRDGDALSKSARSSQAVADSQAGDCSTLRGSLKLIESIRKGHPAAPDEQLASGQQLNAASGEQEWTWRELAEMVKFTRAPLKRPLLRLDASPELERRAVDCFAAIMRYMGDLPPATTIQLNSLGAGGTSKPVKLTIPESDVECVYLILINCHNYPKLRDEIYCQLIKQTTNNRSEQTESCLRGWRLLSLLAAYFDCSAHFRPYLVNYLEQNAFDKRRAYHSVALLCLQNLRKTFKFGGRKNVPSIEEIAALSAGRISKRQIYRLPGGTERVINTKSTTVVDDIIREICTSMLMVVEESEMFEFSLYCIADGDLYTMPLNRDEYILDITTELIKNHQQYFLIFCRSIWHYPLRLDSKLYIELTFNQIAPDYLEGLLLVLPAGSISIGSRPNQADARGASPPVGPLNLKSKLLREIARLAALLHRASGTDHQPQRDEIKYLLPKPIVQLIKQKERALNKKVSGSRGEHYASSQLVMQTATAPTQQQLVELVQEFWREMSAFEPLDAKAQFLDVVRHWPLFGSSFFAIKLIQRDLIQPTDFILALNKFGIQMLEPDTHETRHKYSFNEVISTRKVRSEDGALFLDMKCGNLMKRTIIRIQTDQAHEISRLIRHYIDIELMQANNNPPISSEGHDLSCVPRLDA